MEVKHWAALLASATMFASSFFFNKVAVGSIPPVSVAAARTLLAAPVVLLLMRATGTRLPPLGPRWGAFLLLGVLTVVIPHIGVAWSQRHIDSGLAGIIYAAIPLFTVVLAHFLTVDERLNLGRGGGVLIGLGGIVLLLGPAALAGLVDQLVGCLVALCAAAAYAVSGIYARRFRDVSAMALTLIQFLFAAAVLVPLSLVIDAPWTLTPSAAALGSLAGVAVVSSALPNILIFWLIQRVGATNTSLVAFFIPVIAVALGAVLLGEALPWQAFVGLAMILAGLAFVGRHMPADAKA